jgi:hypothetical protein
LFTVIGKIVGFGTIALGLSVIVGSFLAAPDLQYIRSSEFEGESLKTSTLLLAEGGRLVFFGLVLGILCEISRKLER